MTTQFLAKSRRRFWATFSAVAVGVAAAASAQEPNQRPVEFFNPKACAAPVSTQTAGVCVARGISDATGRFDAPSAQCSDDQFQAAARTCLKDAFRVSTNVAGGSQIEACIRMTFFPGAPGKETDRVRLREIWPCPPANQALALQPPKVNTRVQINLKDPRSEDCTRPTIKKKEPYQAACAVTGQINSSGRVESSSATCEDKALEKSAASCLASYRVADAYKGSTGPICVAMVFIVKPRERHTPGLDEGEFQRETVSTEYACKPPGD